MVGLLVVFFAGFLFCIPIVYSSGASLLFFWSIYCFLLIKKKSLVAVSRLAVKCR